MMDIDQIHRICRDLRYNKDSILTESIVTTIEADVQEYRDLFLIEPVPQLPPPPLRNLLPHMGWLIYEGSWHAVQRVEAAFEQLDPEQREASELAFEQLNRLANCARALIWPEYAPRALGAIRAHALAESKRDTEKGYNSAYTVHREARELHKSYSDSLRGPDVDHLAIIGLDEMFLQIALAETGTACRTAERVIGRWSQDIDDTSASNEARWVQRMYRELSEAIDIGEQAIMTAQRIKNDYGLVSRVDEERMALVTWMRNPGIMTARAALLALALTPAMEYLRRTPAGRTWVEERESLIERFRFAYDAIQDPVFDPDGVLVPLRFEHKRALVQVRLALALLAPGQPLPTIEPFHPCIQLNPLDDAAVEAMSHWLATEEESPGKRNDANAIGSAILPLFIRSVVDLRSQRGDGPGYLKWRRAWPQLGRYYGQNGRAVHVESALITAESQGSLRISGE